MAVVEFLEQKARSSPSDLAEHYAQFADLYKKKLWHQITDRLITFTQLPQFNSGTELIQLYNGFIKDFESKLNSFTLVKIAINIVREFTDLQQAQEYFSMIIKKVSDDPQAHVLALSILADLQLRSGNINDAKQSIEDASQRLEGLTGLDNMLYTHHYKVWTNFYKVQNKPVEFFKNALLFLAYAQPESIPLPEQQQLAFDMGIAALVGENVYNFGELLSQPLLQSLQGTAGEWLVHVLQAFNAGDIAEYTKLVATYREQIARQPALTANHQLLTQKISIVALMELVFKRPANARTVAFADIAAAAHLPVNEVEHLVMKSLSLGLLRGTIDEVAQTVTVQWVQPRVLTLQQIGSMQNRLVQWTASVQSTLLLIEGEAGDLSVV